MNQIRFFKNNIFTKIKKPNQKFLCFINNMKRYSHCELRNQGIKFSALSL